jgi:hypothetical protein
MSNAAFGPARKSDTEARRLAAQRPAAVLLAAGLQDLPIDVKIPPTAQKENMVHFLLNGRLIEIDDGWRRPGEICAAF